MTEPSIPIAENPPASSAARIGWAILILATLYVCYFSHLGAIGFVGPDEPRYAWIARDMAETGDWVTPRLYGKPWFEKPPLFYWGAAASFKLFGVSEAAARLPSAISALLATLALSWLALRLYGAETARWLLLLLPTTVGMIGFSHAASTDMPFSAMLTIAMVCAAVVLGLTRNENTPILPHTPWLALILFGFFLGAAVLAKGPAAIILSGGAVFFWALFTKRWRDAFRLLHPVAIASFCLTALPWYILCARRNPDFFRIFIIEHNFKRFLTPEFQHIQPFWYYVPVLILALLPWTAVFVWTGISRALDFYRTRSFEPCALLFWTFAGFCLIFFTVSKSKLPGYILPIIPALGMPIGESLSSIGASRRRSLCASLCGSTLFLLLSGFLLRPALFRLPRMDSFAQQGMAVLLLYFSVACSLLACAFFRHFFLGAKTCGALAILWICVPLYFTPGGLISFFDHDNSARYLSGRIISRGVLNDVNTYRVNRSWTYGLNFYLHRELPEWNETIMGDSYVVMSIGECQKLRERGFQLQLFEFGHSGRTTQNLSVYRVTFRAVSERASP